jgi:hypothetical protein
VARPEAGKKGVDLRSVSDEIHRIDEIVPFSIIELSVDYCD